MSFSSDVKHELVSIENSSCCIFAQSYGLLLFGRAFSSGELSILTENNDVATAYANAVAAISGTLPEICISSAGKYSVKITDTKTISAITEALSAGYPVKKRINYANFQNSCCYKSFVRGAFLSCGTITSPDKEYHLEFSVSSKKLCEDLIKLFDEFDITPKQTKRGGAYIVYIKNSSDIEDMLTVMGASESSMAIMGTKMLKSVRNIVNRKVNFENANIARTVRAAGRQCEAIRYIRDNGGLDILDDDLIELARLRLENTELSNTEIRMMLSESLTVSGINHRFARIIKTSEELKKKKDGENQS